MSRQIRKILIVDDSPVARRILKSCMPKDRGYELHEAQNGLDGVNRFKELAPDLTFMDLTMPVMDGFAALENIKGVNREAIVIVCTADIQKNSILKAMSLGALTYLSKPASPGKVEEVLARADRAFNEARDTV